MIGVGLSQTRQAKLLFLSFFFRQHLLVNLLELDVRSLGDLSFYSALDRKKGFRASRIHLLRNEITYAPKKLGCLMFRYADRREKPNLSHSLSCISFVFDLLFLCHFFPPIQL